MLRKLMIGVALAAASASANATIVFGEGFDDVGSLGASGWVLTNNSAPVGDTGWFQGNDGVFGSHTGAADSYVAANFLNAAPGGTIDNWLITPTFSYLGDVVQVSFATRTAGEFPGDSLAVYYNTSGSANVADFSLLGTISSTIYPTDWTVFSGYFFGLLGGDLRLAFRYQVPNTDTGGDYIGIDSFTVNTNVPEPGTLALLAVCLIMVPLLRRRRSQV